VDNDESREQTDQANHHDSIGRNGEPGNGQQAGKNGDRYHNLGDREAG
jgi:hypothetical protein